MPRKQKTIRLGIYGSVWDEYMERAVRGILHAASEHRRVAVCDCRLSLPEDKFSSDFSCPPWAGKLDGVVTSVGLGDAKSPEQVAGWLARGGIPAVNIGADVLHSKITTVCLDPTSIARLAVEHLLACGCRRFLHVGSDWATGSQRRAEAFRTELAKHNLPLATYNFVTDFDESEDAPDLSRDALALKPLLNASPHRLGVLTISDKFAFAVRSFCDGEGLAVPGKVAIVGVNDVPKSFAQKPTLTSIRYAGKEIGQSATELLLTLIDGRRRPRKPVLVRATQLIARDSTVPDPVVCDDLTSALEIIRRQACTGLKVQDLVKMLSVSPRWLELAFRKHIDRSPLAEINRMQLTTTRHLLETTELPISHIAVMTGFASPNSLANFFRKHTSLSLTEYRTWIRRGGRK